MNCLRAVGLCFAMFTALLLVSCGSDPSLTKITISPASNTASVVQGQTLQFQAMGTYKKSNQSTSSSDITSQVTWVSANASLATINSSGLATALSPGIPVITASMDGLTDTSNFLITSGSGAPQLTISKVGNGTGTVTGSPGPINCGATCTAFFPVNTTVTLTATPAAGSTFGGWSSNCVSSSSSNVCTVMVVGTDTVTAIFN
ncbi:MAG: Ig-like domain-containing protein [Terriglobales bacterium]